MKDELIKAGKIAKEAREFAKNIVKENSQLLDVAEKIENKIIELGGKCAFPVDLSIGNIAAHYSPDVNEGTIFKKCDLVKVDLGVHIDGYLVDTAITVEVNSVKNKKLMESTNEALKVAIDNVKPGVEVREIGKVIQKTIQSYGFSPIRNLSGHSLDRYKVHGGLSIPNYDNGNKTKLKMGDIVAIEPFATDGVGKVTEGKESGIYALLDKKPIRDANSRKILVFIEKEYNTLPFCRRWLVKKFPLFQVNIALKLLKENNIIKSYSVLPEESKGIVSQSEHS